MMKTTFHAASAVILAFAAVALSSATARADEELVKIKPDDEIGIPKSLNAKVGGEGGIPCIAIQVPLRSGGYLSVSSGKSTKVVNEDAITVLQESFAKLGDKLARFRVGDATFYGFYCKDCGGYEGYAAAMGGFQALFIFPPKGRGLDAESLEILKKVVFIPQKGCGIDSAIKLYGPKSPMKAATKFLVLKKMVEVRPESVELIDLLRDVAKEAGETVAEAWCEAELKRLDPEVYGTPTTSIPMADFTCEQGNEITGGIAIYQKFKKKTVSIPTGTTPPNAKTKTVTLPGGATMEMIWCPPGTFMMGRNVDAPNGGDVDVVKLHAGGGEVKPPVKVTLTKGFWLGKYEVTQAQYKGVMGENPSDSSAIGDNMPVNRVTWDDATKFLKKVGSGARLPTDAEWKYACKAGTDTAFPWGDVCNGQETNCNGTRPFGTMSKGPNIGRPVKVGSYPQNPWGFHDMTGNVSELCSDKFNAYLSTMETRELVDPKGYPFTSQRTLRGGNYTYFPYGCRSVWRQSCPQDWPAPHIGFRMAMDE